MAADLKQNSNRKRAPLKIYDAAETGQSKRFCLNRFYKSEGKKYYDEK